MSGDNFAIKPNRSGDGQDRDLELGPVGNAGVLIRNNGSPAWYFNAEGNLVDQGAHSITAGAVATGENILYRCSTAGVLRAGQTTTVPGDCGTAVDTGLRVN